MITKFLKILLLSLVFCSCLFSQEIKNIKIETADGSQVVLYDPCDKDGIGLNFIQLYKSDNDLDAKLIIELQGEDLPEELVVKTNINKGPEYIHYLINKMSEMASTSNIGVDNVIKELLSALAKSSSDPFLVNRSDNPELSPSLYEDIKAKKISATEYSTGYIPIRHEQIANIVFQIHEQQGKVKTIPLYYEPYVNKSNIYVLNIVVSPESSRKTKIFTVNPYQLGSVVDNKEEATSFKVINRGKWKRLYSSGRNNAQEHEVFENEVFPVMQESSQKMGFLKVKHLNDQDFINKILEGVKSTNSNMVWLMPVNENSPLRMSPDLKNARIVDVGGVKYIVSLAARHPENREELYHKGLFYQHETISSSVSEYLGGNNALIDFVKQLNELGIRVMLEEHPDKVSSLKFSYNSLSKEAEYLIKRILFMAGYEVSSEDASKPFDILTTKLRNVRDGTEIYAYQFFVLKYAYRGLDDPNSPNYVKKEDRVPGKPEDMPLNISEMYVPAVGIPNSDWTTFAQLKMHNVYVELIELVARLDYYKSIFGQGKERYMVGIREDAVHFGILRYDQRSQFIRYINELKQMFPGIIVSGEVIADGSELAWIGMPLDIIQPATLIHRDNIAFSDEYGRNNKGQSAWDEHVVKLKEKGKVYFSSLTSYDTCPAVTIFPFDEYAMLERCEMPYRNYFDAFTKEAYVLFPPTAVNSICAGEECGTLNDYKNFKADQFGYYQMPYEEGNFNQTRIDLNSTYQIMDNIKIFLQDNKYGYNYRYLDPEVLPNGHLSAAVYSSDKGVVMIMRNNSSLSYPVEHKFSDQIVSAVIERQAKGENLYVIYNMYEFDDEIANSFYTPENNMLLEQYDITSNGGVLKLRRNLKPYEIVVLSSLTEDELRTIKLAYNNVEQDQKFSINQNVTVNKPSVNRKIDKNQFLGHFNNNPKIFSDAEAMEILSAYLGEKQGNFKDYLEKLMELIVENGLASVDTKILFGTEDNLGGIYDYVMYKVDQGETNPDYRTFLVVTGVLSSSEDSPVYGKREIMLNINKNFLKLGLIKLGENYFNYNDITVQNINNRFCNNNSFITKFSKGIEAVRVVRY